MRLTIYILLYITFFTSVNAQQIHKTVRREISKTYRFSDEFLLEISAEKADIEIRVVDGNEVRLVLNQVAKNKETRIAERDLSFIHFAEKKERNRLYLHNYAQLEANNKGLSSIINNTYTIEVPRHCHLKIKNELGSITINGIQTTMRFNLSYCSLNISESNGKLYVDSRVGDVTLNDAIIGGEFITENVSIKLQKCAGTLDFQSHFGSISCLMSENIVLFNADLEQCETTLINRTNIDYDYVVEVEKANINVLDEILKEKVVNKEDEASLRTKGGDTAGTIIINSEYGDVNLY